MGILLPDRGEGFALDVVVGGGNEGVEFETVGVLLPGGLFLPTGADHLLLSLAASLLFPQVARHHALLTPDAPLLLRLVALFGRLSTLLPPGFLHFHVLTLLLLQHFVIYSELIE